MTRAHWMLSVAFVVGMGRAALAQDAWVQIEAQPTLRDAEERARAYAGAFPNVAGFELASGWYAIVIGPFPAGEAPGQLQRLRDERLIPSDSYVADPAQFRGRFWPVGPDTASASGAAAEAAAPAVPPAPEATTPTADTAEAAPPAGLPDETPQQARASEAALTGAERESIQAALRWFGVYDGAIDGAFGPGTRRSMAAWQASRGDEETGVLTTRQRQALIDSWQAELADLGLATITDAEAGIEIVLPMNLIEFEGYEPPFVKYRARGDSGVQVLLISQQGDQSSLSALYDLMQTLTIVPLDGPRERGKTGFTIEGRNGDLRSTTQVTLSGGLIKGFTLVTRPDDARAERILAAMRQSLRSSADHALDEGLGQPLSVSAADLTSGLEVRRPEFSRSGFYIDARGTVLTTAEAVDSCDRVTIEQGIDADVTLRDAAVGIAVLKPRKPMAPINHAAFQTAAPRPGTEVALAGYSYQDALDAPVMTFGTLADTKGLDGETGISRLSMATLPGDAGGPVLDSSGAVLGMALPRPREGGRVLPEDLTYVRDATAIAGALAAADLPPEASTRDGSMAPEDLSRLALGMTVLVSCWK